MNVGHRNRLTDAQKRTAMQRAAIASAVASDPEVREVRMPQLQFLERRFAWEKEAKR